ncbi:hypothetical protein QUF64_16575 [Anaerolineales bacterium HSG6]|nr:hypothetical protein [Anaerolineales bacterium HSG6]
MASLVVLVFITLTFLVLFVPIEALPIIIVTPTRTVTLTPISTALPTSPSLLPTANILASVTAEPTPVNTRVPTVTPLPPKTATPTIVFEVPTIIVLPTETPTETPRPLPKPTSTRAKNTPTIIPLSYRIDFKADDTKINKNQCTDLEWDVQGAETIFLDGTLVEPSGNKEVCPKRKQTYRLEVKLPNIANQEIREVTIEVNDTDPIN